MDPARTPRLAAVTYRLVTKSGALGAVFRSQTYETMRPAVWMAPQIAAVTNTVGVDG